MSAGEEQKVEMDLEKECPKFKEIYSNCFMKWYNEEFLTGKNARNICHDEWEDYKACMMLSLKEKNLEVLLQRNYREDAQKEDWSIKNIGSSPPK